MKFLKSFILVVLLLKLTTTIKPFIVEASSDLSVDYGSTSTSPLFKISDFAPGETITKSIIVYNNSNRQKFISIKGKSRNESGQFASVLNLEITNGDGTLYGNKNLKQFFLESSDTHGIFLSSIQARSKNKFQLTVNFQQKAGNEFQANRLSFDLQVSSYIDIPEACKKIHFSTKPIFGSPHRDTLIGTEGNDFIAGFEGNDRIDGKGGDDCILGGEGNDILSGGKGHDIILGDRGKDICMGEKRIDCEL